MNLTVLAYFYIKKRHNDKSLKNNLYEKGLTLDPKKKKGRRIDRCYIFFFFSSREQSLGNIPVCDPFLPEKRHSM